MRKYQIDGRRDDYCQLTTFTSSDIFLILKLVLYLGYGSFLMLGSDGESAMNRSMALFQVQNGGELQIVGQYYTNLSINSSALQWSSGSIPISGKKLELPLFLLFLLGRSAN